MSDEVAFLRAAQAQPDDDTLRLVYADWLEEQGRTSQAAFVRVQVRRSQLDVFDPGRAALLREESRLLQKHKRYWNGPVHRALHARGRRGLIDSRRGAIRTWHYHRGMIARVAVTADGLAEHAAVVSALGPVRMLEVSGWNNWSRDEEQALAPLAAALDVLAIRGGLYRPSGGTRLNVSVFQFVPLLDLRRVERVHDRLPDLRTAVRHGDLPPVVLFRRGVPAGDGGSEMTVHVVDPHRKWDAMRLWFADLTGELLDPVRV